MFVNTEVEKKRTKSRGDGDDEDDIKRVQILLKKGQLSPVSSIEPNLALHTEVTEYQDDEESC